MTDNCTFLEVIIAGLRGIFLAKETDSEFGRKKIRDFISSAQYHRFSVLKPMILS